MGNRQGMEWESAWAYARRETKLPRVVFASACGGVLTVYLTSWAAREGVFRGEPVLEDEWASVVIAMVGTIVLSVLTFLTHAARGVCVQRNDARRKADELQLRLDRSPDHILREFRTFLDDSAREARKLADQRSLTAREVEDWEERVIARATSVLLSQPLRGFLSGWVSRDASKSILSTGGEDSARALLALRIKSRAGFLSEYVGSIVVDMLK